MKKLNLKEDIWQRISISGGESYHMSNQEWETRDVKRRWWWWWYLLKLSILCFKIGQCISFSKLWILLIFVVANSCNSKVSTPDSLLLQMPVTMKVNSMDVKRRSQTNKGHRRVAPMPPRVTINCTEGVTRLLETVHIHHAEIRPGDKSFQRRRSEPELSSAVKLNTRVTFLL